MLIYAHAFLSHLSFRNTAFSTSQHYNGHGMQISLWDGFYFLWVCSQNRAARLYSSSTLHFCRTLQTVCSSGFTSQPSYHSKLGPPFLFFGLSDRSHAKETPFRLFVHFPTSTLGVFHSLRHPQNACDFESFAFVVPSAPLPPRQADSFPFQFQMGCPFTPKASLIILPWLDLISILSSPLEHLQK